MTIRIAVDVMGADEQPHVLLEGLKLAAREWTDIHVFAVGQKEMLIPHMDNDLSNLSIVDSQKVFGPEEKVDHRLRKKEGFSMIDAAKMVMGGDAEAMISAGNTAALYMTGMYVMNRLPGIDRAALAPMIPTVDNVGILALDLGGNIDAKAEHLLQYGVMGSIYREKIHGIKNPRVGLLNIGTEKGKGGALQNAAYDLLSEAPIHFIGNVEARDVLLRNCDVLVCDGFSGNILLKAMEGTANILFDIIRTELSASTFAKLLAAPMRGRLRSIKNKYNYKSTGGGILLGLGGLCFKAHGSSDAYAIKNAIGQARSAVQNNLLSILTEEIGKLPVNKNRK